MPARSRSRLRPRTAAFLLAAVGIGAGREPWPSPPPVDQAAYRKEHEAWLAGERASLSKVLPVTGLWPLGPGETAFGSDPALPIPLPAAHVPPRAGTFRRVGDTVTVAPAGTFALRLEDGSRLDGERQVRAVLAGPLRLEVTDVDDDRRWVRVTDTTHPAIAAPPRDRLAGRLQIRRVE